VGSMSRDWSKKIVTFGGMVIVASLIFLLSMWPTVLTVPKLVHLIIIASPIDKFAFDAS